MDYACFGNVLAFDTTYKTNAYKKPLVVLVGVNHHHQTVVFGCALLMDESIATYEWVLETFLIVMMNNIGKQIPLEHYSHWKFLAICPSPPSSPLITSNHASLARKMHTLYSFQKQEETQRDQQEVFAQHPTQISHQEISTYLHIE